MDNKDGCARCGAADAELYKWTHVSIDADGTSWLCESCFRDVLVRQRATVEKNTIVLQSLKKRGMLADAFAAVGFAVLLVLIMLFLLVPAWPYNPAAPSGPYIIQPPPGVAPNYSPIISGSP